MPDKDASTPRVFLLRHGETEWSQSGRFTGSTEIPLTEHGEEQIKGMGRVVYGDGKLIDPSKVAKVWVSPRERAARTYGLLSGQKEGYETVESLSEWDYGDYEGLLPNEIKEQRKSHGFDQERKWNIWRDGCEAGESPDQVSKRIDGLISKIKELQTPHMQDSEPKDVILVAHGHITKAFAKRWLGLEVSFPMALMMQPGGVSVLSYEHHNIDEPALVMGFGFPSQN